MDDIARDEFLKLKAENEELYKSFEICVTNTAKELEIPREIAERLILAEMVNRNERQLRLHAMFSEKTLKDCKDKV